MPFVADFAGVQSDLHRLYPTAVLEEVDGNALDAHLPRQRLRSILAAVARVEGANAVLEGEIVRSHILHVGCGDAPDWERFNRELSRRQRITVLKRTDGGILYWNIRLSRIGPFWTGNWNLFQIRDDQIVPEVVAPPRTETWTTIIKRVRHILAGHDLREVPILLLHARIPWLRPSRDDTASAPPEHCTVYDALFSDSY